MATFNIVSFDKPSITFLDMYRAEIDTTMHYLYMSIYLRIFLDLNKMTNFKPIVKCKPTLTPLEKHSTDI